MNQRKIRMIALATVVAFLGTAMVAPMAAAQGGPQLSFGTETVSYEQGDSNAIVPDTGRGKIVIPWEYSITSPGYEMIGLAQTQTSLRFTQMNCENSNLKVSGASSIPVRLRDGPEAPSPGDSGTATFFVTATQQAPGETPITCTFTGIVDGLGDQVGDSNPVTARPTVVVKYLGLISASIPTTIKQAGPQKNIDYQFDVRNLGNSISNVRFVLRDAEAAAGGGWNPVAPIPVVLQSDAQGGTDTSQAVSFIIATPYKNGWNNKEKTFTVDITPESTKNPDLKGSTVTVNVLARVRGVYVPTLEPMIMVGAVIGSAMLARLMRSED